LIIGIGGADYSHRYRLQPIPLIISPITSITDVSCSSTLNRYLGERYIGISH